ncbi:MAG: ATP-binding protein, partial [Treponema sp.]|nr:ATP-binding protein [Treponema sp.]
GMNEAFDALLRGEIDMVMATQKRLLYLTHYLELPNFKTNVVFNYVVNSKFGFNKNKAILCSIVDKALGSIDITAISDKWMRQTYDYRLKLSEAQRPLYIGSSILLFVVLVLVAALFVRSRLEGRKLEQLVENRTHDLQMQTNTLNALIDSMPDLVFTMDTNLNFTKCNRKFLDHFGLTKSDVIGKGEECIKFPAKLENDHIMWNRRVLNERLTFVFEEQVPGADGTSPFFETIKSPIMLGNNKVGLLGIARDITKRKEMEETALAASHTKSAFLANMSHEIRTPMNSIMGFSELAMDMTDNPKIKEYLGKIRINSEWLLQIINNILDISKIESGKMELEKIPFDMHDLFASCRTLILPKAVEKGLTLHFYAEPSLGKVPLGDPTRLRQVFVNFLSNAVKFTNSGIVKLFSKITNMSENSLTMYFEIKDSGIGMTPEQMERIFDPFTQAESGTTRMFGGTGLGLSITKNIIEMMGGEIRIESVPKVGTIFSFYLTFDTIDETKADIQIKKADHGDLEKPIFEGEILLCEDNAMNQEVISEHLARVGIKTIIAENGKIGVEKVQERLNNGAKQFDLIFMDIHMPVMDGLEASAKILELKTGIPIIAMTANVMSTDMEIYLKSGMQDCIGKPFTSQELWHLLLRYFMPVDMDNAQESAKIEADKDFFRNIQLIFVKDNKNKYEEICKALETENVKEAYRMAHSLKSNAGQIGKTILQQAAAIIESRLKDGINHVSDEQLKMLEAELNAVLNELQPLLDEKNEKKASAPKPDVSADPKRKQELFEKLEPLLKSGNVECLKLTNELTQIPDSEKLIELIEEYEFHKALAELVRIRGD